MDIPGGMAEWPNAKLLKSFGMQVSGGSNPSPSAGQTTPKVTQRSFSTLR